MRCSIFLALAVLTLVAAASEDKKIVCYFGSWAAYRPGDGAFVVEDIDPKLCTHVIYGFVGLVDDDVKILDPWQDIADGGGKDGFTRFNNLRARNPALKTLVAIGGWEEGSAKYSKMAADPKARARFVKNVVAFVKKYQFDGFDVDWEYPAQREGSRPEDVQNFTQLLKELKEAFNEDGLILSAAVGAARSSASLSYNIREISKHLDFINLMTYDFHGAWESTTGINAPLYPGDNDVGLNRQLTVDAAVQYWLSQGAPAEKLILGIGAYGRSFTLANSKSTGIGAASTGGGLAGPFTRQDSTLGYNEICLFQLSGDWTVVFDTDRRVPYAFKGDQWVGYDNPRSIKEKSQYLKKMKLGGAMVWSVETDDFRGKCGEKYPLLKTINAVLRGRVPVVDETVPEPKPTKAPIEQTPITVVDNDNEGNSNIISNSDGDSSEICKSPGNTADPDTCGFIQCVDNGRGGFNQHPIPCPAGLCYKPSAGVCDWA